MRGCVWVGEIFSSHDKWQIKLLSEFLNLRSTFNDISLCKKKIPLLILIHIHGNYPFVNLIRFAYAKKKCNHKIRVQECNGGRATSCQWCHVMSCDIISVHNRGWGVSYRGGSVMESYQFETLDQYFSVIVTIPHISIKTQSLCIPTYFSVYLKPWEVVIMHKIHKYLKTFFSTTGIICCDWAPYIK